MASIRERNDRSLLLPLTDRQFEIVDEWRTEMGLKNEGVARRLTELARQELEEQNDGRE